jgi:hypothetical protein
VSASDPLIRLLGADPAVFHPLYRVQRLLLQRGVRVVQARARRGLFSSTSPYRLLCFYAVVYGLSSMALVFTSKSTVLGAVVALTLGSAFLLLVVVTDNFDVLVNPREALVLAAHPHDDRTFLLAKLAAIGRSLAILAVLLFFLPGLAAGFMLRSPVASLAFYFGAAASSLSTVTFGLLLAAHLLLRGGGPAERRSVRWGQVAFVFG